MDNATYFPLGRRARWAVILLGATVVVDLVAVAFDLSEISLLEQVMNGEAVSDQTLVDGDNRQATIAVFEVGVLIATAVVFIRWFHAAYRNLAPLGATNPRFTTGWAIGAWFVPILNLWRPKQIADDIWRASDPDALPSQGTEWQERTSAGLLTLWWTMWILGSFAGNIAARLWFTADTATDLRDAARLDVAFLLVDVIAAALAMLVVRSMTRRQLERAGRLVVAPAEST